MKTSIAEAKISEFDLDGAMWRIPHERRKNRRFTEGPFVITLPRVAVDWVRELIQLADGNEYLLPVEARRQTDRIRTCGLCLRRAALYPAELRVPVQRKGG